MKHGPSFQAKNILSVEFMIWLVLAISYVRPHRCKPRKESNALWSEMPSQQGRPDIAAENICQAFKTRVLTFLKHGSVERIRHSLTSAKTEKRCPQCKPIL